MSARRIDLVGQKFGMLTVVSRASETNTQRASKWVCSCECGGSATTVAGHLRNGHTSSCGCLQRKGASRANKTHGLSKSAPEYTVWEAMRRRCNSPTNQDYKYYGGRGIRVCSRWSDFALFYVDMGPRPSPKHSIDRIENDGNYEPGNCRWATKAVQLANRRPYTKRAA